mmetsp:Transcript_26146/g.43607  ORF Transcript_26146/g.43607 Transcript_26146/m.43607 type:complete len:259 (-) Transcript_26146:734-1510(-)
MMLQGQVDWQFTLGSPMTSFGRGIQSTRTQILRHFDMSRSCCLVQYTPTILIQRMDRFRILNEQIIDFASIVTRHAASQITVQQMPSIGMLFAPLGIPRTARNNVGRQAFFEGIQRFFLVHDFRGKIIGVLVEGTEGFKVNENVGKVTAAHGEGAAVQNRMTLVKDHIPRFHGNIVGLSIVSPHFQRPRFVDILININNGRRDQWIPIDVSCQDTIIVINANTPNAARRQVHACPFFQCQSCRFPYLLSNIRTATTFG